MTTTPLSPLAHVPAQRRAALDELAAAVRGAVRLPGTPLYEQLRAPFNTAVDVRPLAVVAAQDAYDVATTVRLAGARGLRVAVAATGHGAGASLEGALLVHTGRLDECVVDPSGWARVGAGVRWRQLLDAAAAHGLTGPAGSSSGVGVVGYTTGGGLGPTARTHGLASDRVRAMDVVTGAGRLVRATATEHADLFWALRGGRGSLGIVTALEIDLLPLTTVLGGSVHFDGADAAAVLHAWRAWSAELPDEATTSLAVVQLPALPHVPPPLAGRMTVSVRYVHTGDHGAARTALAPLLDAAPVLLDTTGPLPASDLDAVHRDPVDPMPAVKACDLLADLPAEAVDALLASAGPGSGSPLAVVELRRLGGAIARPGTVPSAVSHRDADVAVTCIGPGAAPVADAVRAAAARVRDALAPWSTGAALPNFGGGPRAYDAPTLARLRELVALHDPDGVLLAADDLRLAPHPGRS